MIKVIAKNFTHENKKSELIELLKELKHYAIKEKKCIKYELFQDSDNETIITIISEWEKINHLEEYYKSNYFIGIVDKISELIRKESEVNIYSVLE
jgi:quinol monooxygenase YgiN